MQDQNTKLNEQPKKVFTLEDFKRWGSKGGKTTLKRYGKKKAKEWGKLGGDPKKFKKKPLNA